MASDKQATLLANLTRELFMLKSGSASAEITRLRSEINNLRDQHPITRWVDADPQWRGTTGSRINVH